MHSLSSINHVVFARGRKGIMVGISLGGGATNPFLDIMMVSSQQTNSKENITREQAVIAYAKSNAFGLPARQVLVRQPSYKTKSPQL